LPPGVQPYLGAAELNENNITQEAIFGPAAPQNASEAQQKSSNDVNANVQPQAQPVAQVELLPPGFEYSPKFCQIVYLVRQNQFQQLIYSAFDFSTF